MNTNTVLGEEQQVKPLVPPEPRRRTPYNFTPEELRVLKECNRESFFQRCIPLGTLMGLGTYYSVQSGFLKPNARYGATPKVVVSVIAGYFIGKLSYQKKCAEKLMQLPNSPIGELLRRKRQGMPHDSLDSSLGPGVSLGPFGTINPTDVYTDVDAKPSLDLDTSRPDIEGLDDYHRPTIDSSIYEEEMPPVQKKTTTYDELRKKNREEYQQKRSVYRNPNISTPPASQSTVSSELENLEVPSKPSHKVKTNIYGDPVE